MYDKYENPLISRYASKEMMELFSAQRKFSTWRKLWIALAEAEQELGLPITDEQLDEMRAHIDDIDFKRAEAIEKEVRHDVMSHVHAFGEQCPKAKAIIHLGATSAYVGDNTDVIVMHEGMKMLMRKLAVLLSRLSVFAEEYKGIPTLGFTHFQPAQLTTVGKRACLWMMDLVLDMETLNHTCENLRLRGVKGTTGTQASFMSLFDNDHEKVRALDKRVTEKMGFKASFPVTGQTYSRKQDTQVLHALSGIAESLHKMTNDLRLLQHLKEVEEPFEKQQIGSSAMAYKRNPMRSERIASLARYIIAQYQNLPMTTTTQWFERTLDDSANRRLSIPESFLAADAILDIAINVTSGLVVYPKMIERHVRAELPFMATENIMMEAARRGGDRQELHERIRVHSMEAAKQVKIEGLENDLLDRIAGDPSFNLTKEDIDTLMDASKYVGRAPEQVDEFIEEQIKPILAAYQDALEMTVDLKV